MDEARSSRKAVRLKDVAEHLGLSPATVSLVLNRSPVADAIPKATHDRVFAAARELNYRPNLLARSLRNQRTFSVGVLVPEISEGYAAGIMRGVENHLSHKGYFYLLASHRSKQDLLEEYLAVLKDRSVEGFILLASSVEQPPELPTVAVSSHRQVEGVTNVVIDHDLGARLALQHLKDLGHERIAVFPGAPDNADAEDRWRAILETAPRLGLEIRPELTVEIAGEDYGGGFYKGGYEGAQKLVASGADFTALFAFNDISAIGAMKAFLEAGLRVPEDVSVVGFDDIQSAAFHNPGLTTVRQPLREMGVIAASTLLERLGSGSSQPDTVTVQPELVVRGTTGPTLERHRPRRDLSRVQTGPPNSALYRASPPNRSRRPRSTRILQRGRRWPNALPSPAMNTGRQALLLRSTRDRVCAVALGVLAQSMVCAGIGQAQPPSTGGPGDPVVAFERAIAEAEVALRDNEPQIAESRYRSALLEGWLLLGSLAIEDDDLHGAKAAFQLAANSSVETRRPHTSLALVQIELDESAEALSLLRDIVLKNPTDPEARRLFSRALAASGRLEESVQELEQLRTLTPGNLENAFLLATGYLRQGKPDAAEPLFAELAKQRPIPQTWVLIGRIQRDFGNYERARRALDRALDLDPLVRRAHYYLGSIDLLDQGRGMLEEAMAQFEAELEVAPDDPMANLYLGMGLVESRRHEEAVPRLETATRLGAAQRDAFQFLGRSYLALGRNAEAVAALQRALELAESDAIDLSDGMTDLGQSQIASLHYQLAQALRRTGDEEAAAPHFEASKQSSARLAESSREYLDRYLENETRESRSGAGPSLLESSPLAALSSEARGAVEATVTTALAQSYLNLGVLLMRSEHHARAAELFDQAAQLDPKFPQVQYSLGVAHFNAGQFAQATDPLARALEEGPSDAGLRRMLALAWLNSDDYDKAVELLRDDAERATNGSLQYAYGLALVRSGRSAEAETIFARLLTENADWPELNVFLGQAHAQQDDFETAVGFLQRALELAPSVAEANGTLGDIFLRQGKLDEAEAALRTELSFHPGDFRALYTLAVVLDLNRKSEQALTVLRSLLDRAPQMADGRYLLGKILLANGNAERAVEQLVSAAGLSPENPNIHYQLGQALQKLGRTDEARVEFETFRRLKDEQRSGGAP